MTNKRELVLKAFKGEEVDRVPVGFWYHFASENEFLKVLINQKFFQKMLLDIKNLWRMSILIL